MNNWNKVADKLPPLHINVLCVGAKGGMFIGYSPFELRDKATDHCFMMVPNARGRVAHYWMWLPELPSEEE